LEDFLEKQNVKGLQGQRVQLVPNLNNEKLAKIRHFTGQKNNFNQIYTVRNVIFEPYSDPATDWVAMAMKDIANAFFWDKPAIIGTHRINYVSTVLPKNKDNSLLLLNQLLKTIIKVYPDVDFLTSDELIKLINLN
jgi:hypothetical protein